MLKIYNSTLFKMISIFICYPFLCIQLIGCATATREYYTVQVPYTKKVPVEKTRKIPYTIDEEYEIEVPYTIKVKTPIYKRVEPRFPLKSEKIRLAIISFEDASGLGTAPWGKEVSTLLEHSLHERLRDKELVISEENNIRELLGEPLLISEEERNRWFDKFGVRYKIVDREKMNVILQEKELRNEGETKDSELSGKQRLILEADALIKGYVSQKSEENVSFLIKATDLSTSEIVFSGRYSGKINDAVIQAIKEFFYDIELVDVKEEEIEKTRTEKKTRQVTKHNIETYTDYEEVTEYREELQSYESENPGKSLLMGLIYAGLAYMGVMLLFATPDEEE